MIQKEVMDFICAADLVKYRFVTIDKATDTVAYTAAGAKPDGITIGDESNLKIAVQFLGNLNASFWYDAETVIAKGDEIEVGTDGKGTPQVAGAIACYAKIAAVDGSFGVGYNVSSIAMSAVGTPGVGVTAVEEGNGSFHKTILTVNGVLPTIAGGANLAAGLLVYTLPAGAKIIKSTKNDMALTALDGHIDADTPFVGLGTTLGTTAVLNLTNPATLQDLNIGKAAANCTGTLTVQTTQTTDGVGGLVIETGDAHTIHFNVADDWAASGEAACPITGTIIIEWYNAG